MVEGERSFAAVLDGLCRHPGDRRRPCSNVELSEVIRERGGDVGHAYISQLRTGRRDNPTRQTIEELAAALGVHPARLVGGRRKARDGKRPSWSAALRYLFDNVYPPDRGPYTAEEVAAAISANGRYGSISASYVRELLSGESDNPRLKHILGLADHFGAEPAYFFDHELADQVNAEITDFVELRDAGVVTFVTRMAEQAAALRPELRHAAVQALTSALEEGQSEWSFPLRGSWTDRARRGSKAPRPVPTESIGDN